jgi:hypothetical protein
MNFLGFVSLAVRHEGDNLHIIPGLWEKFKDLTIGVESDELGRKAKCLDMDHYFLHFLKLQSDRHITANSCKLLSVAAFLHLHTISGKINSKELKEAINMWSGVESFDTYPDTHLRFFNLNLKNLCENTSDKFYAEELRCLSGISAEEMGAVNFIGALIYHYKVLNGPGFWRWLKYFLIRETDPTSKNLMHFLKNLKDAVHLAKRQFMDENRPGRILVSSDLHTRSMCKLLCDIHDECNQPSVHITLSVLKWDNNLQIDGEYYSDAMMEIVTGKFSSPAKNKHMWVIDHNCKNT